MQKVKLKPGCLVRQMAEVREECSTWPKSLDPLRHLNAELVQKCKIDSHSPACPFCGAVDCDSAHSSGHECSSGFEPGVRKICDRCGRMNCESVK